MKLGIDIDDVITKSMEAYVEDYNKNYNDNLKYENIIDYRLWNLFKDFTEKDLIKFFDDFFEEKAYKLDLVKGVKEALNSLNSEHEIILITSRPAIFNEKTKQFIDLHFPELDLKIIHSDTSTFNHSGKDKVDLCLENGIDILIEDQLRYAKKCADKNIKTFLFDCPWNQDVEENENMVRVKNWSEILEKLK
jgi:uncharacterized HAD superfamily protein